MGTHMSAPRRSKARKLHQCIACFGSISIGETYVMQSGHYDDRAFRNKFHIECWNFLCQEGEFEFTPGELEQPERLHQELAKTEVGGL